MKTQHTPTGANAHSYLWRQVFFTDPIGQWLCTAGHSCRWSIARSDAGAIGRVQRALPTPQEVAS